MLAPPPGVQTRWIRKWGPVTKTNMRYSPSMGGSKKRSTWSMAIAIFALFAATSAMADAARPGTNGVIAFDQRGTPWDQAGFVNPITQSVELMDVTGSESNISFFPNGRRVVYVKDQTEIETADYLSGRGQETLLDSSSGWGCCSINNPVVSPSGNEIYFGVSDPNSVTHALWALNIKNRGLRLVKEGAIGTFPVVSPDGSTIAISADGGESSVLFMNADGTNQRFVDTGGLGGGISDFSPDGKRIIFSASSGPYPAPDYLYEKELGSSEPPAQIDIGNQLSASNPIYSPDGKFVAFNGEVFEGDSNVYRVRLSDNRVTSLTFGDEPQTPSDWQRTAVAIPRSWKPRSRVLTLGTFARGRIRVSGKSVRLLNREFNKGGLHRIALKLKPRAQRTLRSKGRIAIRMKISVQNIGERWSTFSIKRVVKSTN